LAPCSPGASTGRPQSYFSLLLVLTRGGRGQWLGHDGEPPRQWTATKGAPQTTSRGPTYSSEFSLLAGVNQQEGGQPWVARWGPLKVLDATKWGPQTTSRGPTYSSEFSLLAGVNQQEGRPPFVRCSTGSPQNKLAA